MKAWRRQCARGAALVAECSLLAGTAAPRRTPPKPRLRLEPRVGAQQGLRRAPRTAPAARQQVDSNRCTGGREGWCAAPEAGPATQLDRVGMERASAPQRPSVRQDGRAVWYSFIGPSLVSYGQSSARIFG
jgi:hypothetical protein